jgi:hypothetical protein
MTRPSPARLLGQRLRDEGHALMPPFSPLLHERTMAHLRAHAGPALDLAGPPRPVALRWAVRAAAAAAIAAVAWIALKPHAASPVDPRPGPIVQVPSITPDAVVHQVSRTVGLPTAAAWEEAKYGYLDKDVRRLALFVADQIPRLPTPPKQD